MAGKKPKVLIVDDEKVICDLLYEELGERGYQCTTALDGDSAIAKTEKESFDAVLLDIRLPGISGMDVLRELLVNHPDTAILMVTAVNDVNTAVEAMKIGATDYIVKPFDIDGLNDSINNALQKKQGSSKSSHQMDAIATGVEAQLDPFSAYSKTVTQKTAEIARGLDIDEEEIQKWVESKGNINVGKGKIAGVDKDKLG